MSAAGGESRKRLQNGPFAGSVPAQSLSSSFVCELKLSR